MQMTFSGLIGSTLSAIIERSDGSIELRCVLGWKEYRINVEREGERIRNGSAKQIKYWG